MKCWQESMASYYGVDNEFPYDNRIWFFELEDSDKEEVQKAIIESLESEIPVWNLDEKVVITLYCDKTDDNIDFEVFIGDWFSEKEWKSLQEEWEQEDEEV